MHVSMFGNSSESYVGKHTVPDSVRWSRFTATGQPVILRLCPSCLPHAPACIGAACDCVMASSPECMCSNPTVNNITKFQLFRMCVQTHTVALQRAKKKKMTK